MECHLMEWVLLGWVLLVWGPQAWDHQVWAHLAWGHLEWDLPEWVIPEWAPLILAWDRPLNSTPSLSTSHLSSVWSLLISKLALVTVTMRTLKRDGELLVSSTVWGFHIYPGTQSF